MVPFAAQEPAGHLKGGGEAEIGLVLFGGTTGELSFTGALKCEGEEAGIDPLFGGTTSEFCFTGPPIALCFAGPPTAFCAKAG